VLFVGLKSRWRLCRAPAGGGRQRVAFLILFFFSRPLRFVIQYPKTFKKKKTYNPPKTRGRRRATTISTTPPFSRGGRGKVTFLVLLLVKTNRRSRHYSFSGLPETDDSRSALFLLTLPLLSTP
jgi:hypothetical protein